MFDSSLKIFKMTRDAADQPSYLEKIEENGITDLTSYDMCHNPEIYRKFYYVPFAERKYKRNYPELNEIRRVLDYPYYFESVDIDDIFNIPKDLRVSKKKHNIDRLTVDLRLNQLEEERKKEENEKKKPEEEIVGPPNKPKHSRFQSRDKLIDPTYLNPK
jgi:hypothetical protein